MENSPFIVEFATKPVHLGGFPLPFLITKGYHDWLIVKFHPAPSRHTWGTAAGAPAANSQPCLHQSMRWKKERSLEADWKSKQSRLRLCLVCPWILQKIIRSSLVFQPSGREEGHAIERQVNWSHILAFILHSPFAFCGVNHYSGSFWIIIARGFVGRQQQIENHQANSGPNL